MLIVRLSRPDKLICIQDLIKQTPPIEAMEKELPLGLAAIERITSAINEAIRKSENIEIVKDLEGRVEDWKGHKLEHFGELLLHGQFSVIKGDQKGDVEREVIDLSAPTCRSLTD
jgi:cell division control protein 24